MRFDKFTIKSQELIQEAQTLASHYNNQQIEPEHLLLAMLSDKESIAKAMLKKLGVSPGAIKHETAVAIDKLSKITGVSDVYISSRS